MMQAERARLKVLFGGQRHVILCHFEGVFAVDTLIISYTHKHCLLTLKQQFICHICHYIIRPKDGDSSGFQPPPISHKGLCFHLTHIDLQQFYMIRPAKSTDN